MIVEKIRYTVLVIVAFCIFAVVTRHYWGITGYMFVLLAYWGMGVVNNGSLQTCDLNIATKGIVASVCLIGFSNSILLLCIDRTSIPAIPSVAEGVQGAICIILLAPIIEEVLFRGIILRSMLEIKIPSYISILLSAIIFGACHGNVYSMTIATISGIAFGLVYWRTKSLYPTMILHFFNNAASFRNLHATDSVIGPSILFDHPYIIPMCAIFLGIGSLVKFKQFITMTSGSREKI